MSKRRPRPEPRVAERSAAESDHGHRKQAADRKAAVSPELKPRKFTPRPAPKRPAILITLGIVLLCWYGFLIYAALAT